MSRAQREASHQLRGWLGIPSSKAHRQADRWLDRIDHLDDVLSPPADLVLSWRPRRRAA